MPIGINTAAAAMLNLSSEQVLLARAYIEEHRAEVMADYEKIMARIRRGNPPEVLAKLEVSRAKLRAEMEKRRLAKLEEVQDARLMADKVYAKRTAARLWTSF